jgi:hypothetical protein
MTVKRKVRPVLTSDWWLIGPSPDLRGILPGADAWAARDHAEHRHEHNAPVDHHLFQDPKGTWHLWGCVRQTAVGRILYHWQADDFRTSPWACTGEIVRIRSQYGESYGSSPGEGESDGNQAECIQSPYVIQVEGTFYMFYGGGAAKPTLAEQKKARHLPGWMTSGSQMCLMTSQDGIAWTRHRNADGNSRLFIGPGPTRDPVLINVQGLWHLYYAGTQNGDPAQPVFWCRTSRDLYAWSEPILVHRDLKYGKGRWDTECPFVIFKAGYYYLFRTEDYYKSLTHVFRSEDPLNFGIGDASGNYVGVFPAAAPELYEIEGRGYVSSNHNPRLGTQMAEMAWVEDE